VVGMTSMPEAKLAREAELCYATVAMVTDYDCWRVDQAHVTADQVVAVMERNIIAARALLRRVVPRLRNRSVPCSHGCDRALDGALMTAPPSRDPEVVTRLGAVMGRLL
jgi:5'-methylthioadenosine phosphorylase